MLVRSADYQWGTHEPEVRAYLSVTGGGLPHATVRALNKFVRKGKRDGWWSKLAEIYPFCGPSLAAALVPLKRADGTLTPLTNNSFVTGDYSESAGFGSSSNGRYLDTGVTFAGLSISSTNFSLGGMVLDATIGGSGYIMGDTPVSGDVNFYYSNEGFGPSSLGTHNSASGISARVWTGGVGRALNVQSGVPGYRYASSLSFIPVGNIQMLRRNLVANPQYFRGKIGLHFIGAELAETEAKALSLAILKFERTVRAIANAPSWPWLFVGDSITWRLGASTTVNQWSYLVASARSRTEYNLGSPSSATTFDSGTSSAILSLTSRYQDILQLDAGRVIIEYGVNDAQQDSSTNGDAIKTATYQSGMTTILQAFAARYGAMNVYVVSTAWRTDKNPTFNTLWNNAMSAAANAAGVNFIDFYSYFVSQGSPAGWMQDAVHFNNTGNANFANYLLTIL